MKANSMRAERLGLPVMLAATAITAAAGGFLAGSWRAAGGSGNSRFPPKNCTSTRRGRRSAGCRTWTQRRNSRSTGRSR
jgi:hypothetical protein